MSHYIAIDNEKDWLETRSHMLTASVAGSYMGLDEYSSPDDLYDHLTGRVEYEDISDNEAVRFGKQAEEHIRALAGLYLPNYQISYHQYDIITPDHDKELEGWFGATLDGDVFDTETQRHGILEIKTGTCRGRMSLLKKWGENGNKDYPPTIPMRYYCQTLHQLLAYEEAEFVTVVALVRCLDYDNEDATPVSSLFFRSYTRKEAEEKGDLQSVRSGAIRFWSDLKAGRRPSSKAFIK